jgi:hypothetical protein
MTRKRHKPRKHIAYRARCGVRLAARPELSGRMVGGTRFLREDQLTLILLVDLPMLLQAQPLVAELVTRNFKQPRIREKAYDRPKLGPIFGLDR